MPSILYVCALLVLTSPPRVAAQTGAARDLEPHVIEAIDRVYPGFTEILQSSDTIHLSRLAETLGTSQLLEAAPVLEWMLEHRPEVNPELVSTAAIKLTRSIANVPAAPLLRTLRNGNADQRRAAAIVLLEWRAVIVDEERPAVERALIGALSDPSRDVRTWVALSLRESATSTALAALAASVNAADVQSKYYGAATGKRRVPASRAAPAFAPDLVTRVNAIAPGFTDVLQNGDEQAMRRLTETLSRTRTTDTAAVLACILANGDMAAYGEWVARLLVQSQQASGGVPIADVADLLRKPDPDRRLAAATFFEQLFTERQPRVTLPERATVVDALTSALADPVIDVARVAAAALSRVRARESVKPLLESLDRPDASRWYLTTVFNALGSIGDPGAVPVLERWARAPRDEEVRTDAARVAIHLRKPQDRGAVGHALMWEAPDTSLEREVLARGKDALPLVWEALAGTAGSDRRAALALLGWFRDVRSIPHILTALDTTHGALSRQQLLFDLNVILLTEGTELNETAPVDALSSQHLAQMLDDLRSNTPASSPPPCAAGVIVYPREVPAAFRPVVTGVVASVASSPEAFDAWLKQTKSGCGIAFHPVLASSGVARVASTLFGPGGAIQHTSWNTLHRKVGSGWLSIPLPPTDLRPPAYNRPNLSPTINRDYGALDPLKIVRFELLMRRIELRYDQRDCLRLENAFVPEDGGEIDRTYLPLLERYRTSDNPNVRYVAEFEIARLTGDLNVRAMIDAVERQPDGQLRRDAFAVLSNFMLEQFKSHGTLATRAEQTDLVNTLMEATARDIPAGLEARQVTAVKKWTSFGLAEVRLSPDSTYWALLERRGTQWVFICVISGGIS